MRFFNTLGPCDPAKHYTVMRIRTYLILTQFEQASRRRSRRQRNAPLAD